VDPHRVLIFGVESFHHRKEWEFARDVGVRVVTADQARREGLLQCLTRELNRITDGVDRLYASLDIDVLARSFAPGTGNAVGTAGLEPTEALEVARELRQRPLVGLDLVEVAPRWDPTGRTAGSGATLIVEALWDRLFEETPL
jgi:arginase family enzyme